MIGSARCNQMRQQNIAQLAQLLEPWSALVRLEKTPGPSSQFGVSGRIDGPPRYRSMFAAEERPYLLGIDPHGLVRAIEQHLQSTPESAEDRALALPEGVSLDLLHHVSAAWGDVSERSFQRTPAQGSMKLCIGMTLVINILKDSGEEIDFSDDILNFVTFRQRDRKRLKHRVSGAG